MNITTTTRAMPDTWSDVKARLDEARHSIDAAESWCDEMDETDKDIEETRTVADASIDEAIAKLYDAKRTLWRVGIVVNEIKAEEDRP